jgi:hypothetical protein
MSAILITIIISIYSETLRPFWFIQFFLFLVISLWITDKIEEWTELKKYKAKLKYLESHIEKLNFQTINNEINTANGKFEILRQNVKEGGFIRENQSETLLKHLAAYKSQNKVYRKPKKKSYKRKYY